ncbi:MAG: tetratricopeptide repeat protein [Desulfatitalea sp.]
MQIVRVFKNLGLFVGVGCFLLLVLAPCGQAEYANPAIAGQGTAAYWLDQGGMLCTYGNFKAAVRAYEKALALDPRDSEIHFSLGVAFAEMGDYPNALVNIDKAIALSPDKARYQYGRAWTLLLSGRAQEAQPLFQRAADLGNIDAQNYLQR